MTIEGNVSADAGLRILWGERGYVLTDGAVERVAVPVGGDVGVDHYEAITVNIEEGTLGREYVSLVPYFGIEDAAEYGEYRIVEPGGLLVEAARLVAEAAHAGQVDKGGAPYIEHPAFVADRVRWLGGDEAAVAAGWLHDVVEDTRFTLDALAVVFPESVMGAVDALTRRDGEPYFDYVERARGNEAACLVKISDLEHNLDESRLGDGADVEATSARMERYREAMHRLIPGDDGGIA
jgi:possible metal-dependent phosphohydrolase